MIDDLFAHKPPLRIGHMGAAGLAPGNSQAAIEAALRIGVDLVELDVWRTADDELVLGHFEWLSPDPAPGGKPGTRARLHALRTFRSWPRITQSTLAELRRLPAPPATLQEALDLMRGRALPYLDLRSSGIAERLCAVLQAGAPDGALLGAGPGRSFKEELALLPTLRATSGVAVPFFGRGLSTTALAALARDAIRRARTKGATGLSVEYHLIKPAFLDVCRQEGFFVFAWTVDDVIAMRRLATLGVDGIITNRPDLLAAALE